MSGLIVLTCASGKQCSYLIPKLYQTKYKLRLVVLSDSSRERLQNQWPKAEVIATDLDSIAACNNVVRGASVIYFIAPSFHPNEAQIGINIIDAVAAEASRPGTSVQHFVFSSLSNTQFSKMQNHDRKRYIEEHLMESDLNWTILQPGQFLDSLVSQVTVQHGSTQPVYEAWWDPTVRFSFLSLEDLADVSIKVIQEGEAHYYSVYPLTSTKPMQLKEMIDIVGEEMGVQVRIKELSLYEAVDELVRLMYGTLDVEQRHRDGPERIFLFYNKRGLPGNPNVMHWLLGRAPTTIRDTVNRQLKAT